MAVNININFIKSAFAGDLLLLETDVNKKSERSVTMSQKVFLKDSKTLIADATVTNVFLEGKTGKVITTKELSGFWTELSGLASPDRNQ